MGAADRPKHPDWAQPGREVIVVSSLGYVGPPSLSLATVTRLTPTMAILSTGARFRLVSAHRYQGVGDYRDRIVERDHSHYTALLAQTEQNRD